MCDLTSSVSAYIVSNFISLLPLNLLPLSVTWIQRCWFIPKLLAQEIYGCAIEASLWVSLYLPSERRGSIKTNRCAGTCIRLWVDYQTSALHTQYSSMIVFSFSRDDKHVLVHWRWLRWNNRVWEWKELYICVFIVEPIIWSDRGMLYYKVLPYQQETNNLLHV